MKYKLVIFDLDGTILNTLDDLADATNYTLRTNGQRERNLGEVRKFVGNGIRNLIKRAAEDGTPEEQIDRMHADFMQYYREHCADKTRPYEGIMDLLGGLKKEGYRLAVVSNKADSMVGQLCEQYFEGIFDYCVGECAGISRKPAPDSVIEVLNKLRFDREDAVYIGDSEVDIETAANARMDCISVTWGFRDEALLKKCGAKLLAGYPWQLADYL